MLVCSFVNEKVVAFSFVNEKVLVCSFVNENVVVFSFVNEKVLAYLMSDSSMPMAFNCSARFSCAET